MTSVSRSGEGLTISAVAYRLAFPKGRPFCLMEDAEGRRWAELALAWSAHRLDALDETALVGDPSVVSEEGTAVVLEIELVSTAWSEKRLLVECAEETVSFALEVRGEGALTDVHLFGGYSSADARYGSGWFPSERHFETLFSPEPHGPERICGSAATGTAIDVVGGQGPGRGHWFFTPAPFCFAFAQGDPPQNGYELPPGPWLAAGLLTPPGEHRFGAFGYEGGEETFAFKLEYQGRTRVSGAWRSPWLTLMPGNGDPYGAIARHRAELERRDLVAVSGAHDRPAWWREPIFCGWGAQVHLARGSETRAPDLCTQARYDEFMTVLDRHGVFPGTVVIDDKWQRSYGRLEADTERWPDMRGWIETRHERGQRVLLWFKAWDPEGLPAEWCVRNAAGRPVAADPTNPGYAAYIAEALSSLLGPASLDADGLKIDFTAHTPSGPGLESGDGTPGVELLHALLALIYRAAKAAKPDALIVSHAPNPYFADVADMIRLNDMLRLERIEPGTDVVRQMRHRAAVVAAACPGLLIDTDDWQVPDLDAWRRYRDAKADFGVPCLYYTTHVGLTGEPLVEQDYAALRTSWAGYRGGPAR